MIVDAGPIEGPHHLSPSSIGTWQQCPYRFRLSRLEKIPEPSTSAQLMGSFVHEVLEVLYQQERSDRTIPMAKKISRDLWDEKWAEEVEVLQLTKSALNEFRWNSWWCVEALFGFEDPQTFDLDGIEQRLELKVGDATLLGIIDRWNKNADGTVTISDYKTGKKPRPQYEGEKRFQLAVYVNLVEKVLELPVSYAELLYLKEGVRWGFAPTEKMRHGALKVIEEVWSQIQQSCATGQFECKVSKLCNWCSYQNICPAWSNK